MKKTIILFLAIMLVLLGVVSAYYIECCQGCCVIASDCESESNCGDYCAIKTYFTAYGWKCTYSVLTGKKDSCGVNYAPEAVECCEDSDCPDGPCKISTHECKCCYKSCNVLDNCAESCGTADYFCLASDGCQKDEDCEDESDFGTSCPDTNCDPDEDCNNCPEDCACDEGYSCTDADGDGIYECVADESTEVGCTYVGGTKCYSSCCISGGNCAATGNEYGYYKCDTATGTWDTGTFYAYNDCTGPCAATTTDPCAGVTCTDGWENVGSSYACCDGNKKCTCQYQEYQDHYCSGGSCNPYTVTNTRTVKSGCSDCTGDGWYNVGSSYACCDGNKKCTCQDQKYRNYYCSGTSCTYSVTNTQTVKSSCTDCGSCASCSAGSCNNYCSGADTNCGCTSCENCDIKDGCYNQYYRNYYCSKTICKYSSKLNTECAGLAADVLAVSNLYLGEIPVVALNISNPYNLATGELTLYVRDKDNNLVGSCKQTISLSSKMFFGNSIKNAHFYPWAEPVILTSDDMSKCEQDSMGNHNEDECKDHKCSEEDYHNYKEKEFYEKYPSLLILENTISYLPNSGFIKKTISNCDSLFKSLNVNFYELTASLEVAT